MAKQNLVQRCFKSALYSTNKCCSPIYLYLAFVYDNRLERKENTKVARPSIFVGTPSIYESLRLKQIDLFCKNIQ